MLRIGICDDSADARDALRVQLEKILNEETEEIVYEFSTGSGAVHWLEKHPGEIDLLFLDVEMAGTNGMAAAEAVRGFDAELIIVFVTGYSDYVFDGYKVNALDYIIKPAKSERLSEVLRRVRAQIKNRKSEMYVFKNADGIFRLPIAAVQYFYSDKRKVVLVCNEKEYPLRQARRSRATAFGSFRAYSPAVSGQSQSGCPDWNRFRFSRHRQQSHNTSRQPGAERGSPEKACKGDAGTVVLLSSSIISDIFILAVEKTDLMIICDKDKLDGKRCNGAPDFIIEIVSPSNPSDDYIRKLYYYKNAGVREYWIVDPRRKMVTVNYFEGNMLNIQYSFDAAIKVNIYKDLFMNFSDITKLLDI